MSATAALPAPGIWQRVADALYLHLRLLLFLLLAPPLAPTLMDKAAAALLSGRSQMREASWSPKPM